MAQKVLEVKNLFTGFNTEAGHITVVDDVSFEISQNETLGIVGESGCGKSVTSLSIMRLLPKPAGHIMSGEVLLDGQDITKISSYDMHSVRGNKISMIFQEPMTALNPVQQIGKQIKEVYNIHFPKMTDEEIKQESIRLLTSVGIPSAEKRLKEYPHQLSGGIRQRVVIAIALACHPRLLIADEPTTALDVTIQAQILRLMKQMQKEYGMAIMFITHDLGVVAELCEQVVVMYAGKIVEKTSVIELFNNPKHPYTKGLLESIPRLDHPSKTPLKTIEGMVPDLFNLPAGCRFQNRCPFATTACNKQPELKEINEGHFVACIHHNKVEK